jgi:hypothetical protein
MKHVFSNHSEVLHRFANQQSEDDYASVGNISFRNNQLYSYGACIAHIIDQKKNIVLITTRQYSVTTSQHISGARSALSHYTQIYAYNVDIALEYPESAKRYHKSNINIMIDELQSYEKKQKTARIRDYTSDFSAATKNLQQYIDLFHIKSLLTKQQREYYKGKTFVVDMDKLLINREAQEAINTRRNEAREERYRLQRERWEKAAAERKRIELLTLPEKIELFHKGEIRSLPYGIDVAYLRLNNDHTRIETSKGAHVLTDHARVLWNTIIKTRERGIDYTPSVEIKIDYYTVTVIKANGDLVIGCHNIPYEESKAIALSLGWITE